MKDDVLNRCASEYREISGYSWDIHVGVCKDIYLYIYIFIIRNYRHVSI